MKVSKVPQFKITAAGDSWGGDILLASDGKVYFYYNDIRGIEYLGIQYPATEIRLQQVVGIKEKAIRVGAGARSIVVLTQNGLVYTWGKNDYGQLGNGSSKTRKRPRIVKGLLDKVASISVGEYHVLALTEKGQLLAWGTDSNGQLGLGGKRGKQLIPKMVRDVPKDISNLAVGDFHTLVLTNKDELWAMGDLNANRETPIQDPLLNPRIIDTVSPEILQIPFISEGRVPSLKKLEMIKRYQLCDEIAL